MMREKRDKSEKPPREATFTSPAEKQRGRAGKRRAGRFQFLDTGAN
jgi:hypothetical protein